MAINKIDARCLWNIGSAMAHENEQGNCAGLSSYASMPALSCLLIMMIAVAAGTNHAVVWLLTSARDQELYYSQQKTVYLMSA